MKVKSLNLILLPVIFYMSCNSASQQKKEENVGSNDNDKVELINQEADQKVDVMIGGKLFTSYCYSDTLMKQILYPILTVSGAPITRGWPFNPRSGERTNEPHQRAMWLNYGDVNGYDFWGNSYAIPAEERKVHEGRIKFLKIEKLSSGNGEGSMAATASWIAPTRKELLAERTEYHFIAKGTTRIIDRITTLTATNGQVLMKDTKEGFFAIRVARQLELPSKDTDRLTDANGNPSAIRANSNEGVTGNYISSEGITGLAVWSTRAKWMDLFGNINGEKVSLVICDHPKNFGYPTYWHARGYGLFAANPFGAKDFTNGKKVLNYTISAGKSLTFRYRVIISSGQYLTDDEINALDNDFAKKY